MIRSEKNVREDGLQKASMPFSDFRSEAFSYAAIHLDWTSSLVVCCYMVRTRFALILYFHMVAQKAACHTLSKAF